ncbi:MAG: hypothetical protein Kow00108_03150 [Calditrichia bacterium]
MAYTVIARKYRPMLFEDVVGQEHVTRTLINALKQNRIAHAYIFSGPRGVGKTTTARLLAKAVNCEHQPAVNPCNQCSSCQAITMGNSMDVIEIDGASNRGIDEVRNIRDAIRYAPAGSRYKIYIIDEVHMLTRDAFNALLKTLEEPPAHAMFMFATTEIHKVPLTILSRCQRYDFKRIPITVVKDKLHDICQKEQINISDDALFLIAKKGDGSMRDAQSLLDQVISFSSGEIKGDDVRDLLGLIDSDLFFSLTGIIRKKDTKELITLIHEIISSGHDLNDFLLQLEEHVRNLLIAATLKKTDLIDASDVDKSRYLEQMDFFTEDQLLKMLSLISDNEPKLRNSAQPELLFEITLLKMLKIPDLVSMDKVLGFIAALKKTGARFEVDENVLKNMERSGGMMPSETADLHSSAGHVHKKESNASPASAKPVADDRLTIEKIREIWEDFLNWMEEVKKKPMVKSFLSQCYPYLFTENLLTLAMDKHSDNAYLTNYIQTHMKELRKWMEEYFKQAFQIKLIEIHFKEEGIEWTKMSTEELVKMLKEENPNFKLLDENFDVDILDN